VYHAQTLVRLLPSKHPLRHTYIFREVGLLQKLSEKISIEDSHWLHPTGIPPHIELYKQQELIHEAVHMLPDVLTEKMSDLIEKKGVRAGNITHELLKETISDLIQLHLTPQNEIQKGSHSKPDSAYEMYCWGGAFHVVPEDFRFPSVDALTAWKLWWLGNASMKYPPFSLIQSRSLSTRENRKTLSDWRIMMGYIVEIVQEKINRKIEKKPSEDQVQRYWDIARAHMPLKERAPHQRNRRSAELKIRTVLRLLREANQAKNPNRRTLPFKKRKRASKVAPHS
jgi:hypothetical protein